MLQHILCIFAYSNKTCTAVSQPTVFLRLQPYSCTFQHAPLMSAMIPTDLTYMYLFVLLLILYSVHTVPKHHPWHAPANCKLGACTSLLHCKLIIILISYLSLQLPWQPRCCPTYWSNCLALENCKLNALRSDHSSIVMLSMTTSTYFHSFIPQANTVNWQ